MLRQQLNYVLHGSRLICVTANMITNSRTLLGYRVSTQTDLNRPSEILLHHDMLNVTNIVSLTIQLGGTSLLKLLSYHPNTCLVPYQ